MAGPARKWVSKVKTVSTFPPEGLFTKDAETIAHQSGRQGSERVAPGGTGESKEAAFQTREGRTGDAQGEFDVGGILVSGRFGL